MALDILMLQSKLEHMETETIDRVLQDEPPYHELDEMEAEDFGRRVQCCRSIPCLNPEECPR